MSRQTEFLHLRAAQEAALLAVREHPLMAAAIADHRWASTLRALCEAAREPERQEQQEQQEQPERAGDQAAA
jgi:hypothetical protein